MDKYTYRKVVEKLTTMASLKTDLTTIGPETEIYQDLRIYGDDLFELLIWINDEFDVQIIIEGAKYAPGETPFFAITQAIRKALGGGRKRYKSLTVRDIVQAIDAGGGRFD